MEGRARWVIGRVTYSGEKDLFCGVIPSLKVLGTVLKDKKKTEKMIEERARLAAQAQHLEDDMGKA